MGSIPSGYGFGLAAALTQRRLVGGHIGKARHGALDRGNTSRRVGREVDRAETLRPDARVSLSIRAGHYRGKFPRQMGSIGSAYTKTAALWGRILIATRRMAASRLASPPLSASTTRLTTTLA
jgi:hypothetical protein